MIQRFSLTTSQWGEVKILRPTPHEQRVGEAIHEDPWGELSPLRETSFASLIPVVSGEVFSMALHGYAKPLMEQIGPEPRYQLIRIPPLYRQCSQRKPCLMFDSKVCRPGHKRLPECWAPEVEVPAAMRAVAMVTHAWTEDRYVVIVEGGEFTL